LNADFEEYKEFINERESKYANYAFKSINIKFLDETAFDEYYSNLFKSSDTFNKERNKYRTPLQVERDRILHSPLFARLAYKTQLFTSEKRSTIENRLTHTLKVMQISRSIAIGLQLNEDLVEAIALGHDLGHPPFAHEGEKALQEWSNEKLGPPEPQLPYDIDLPVLSNISSIKLDKARTYLTFGNDPKEELFMHGRQGFRLLVFKRKTERREKIRFSRVVMYGIWRHSVKNFQTDEEFIFKKSLKTENINKDISLSGKEDITLEAHVVRLADDIAWIVSDLEEGINNGILTREYVCNVINNNVEDSMLYSRLSSTFFSIPIKLDELISIFISEIIKNNLESFKRTEEKERKVYFPGTINQCINSFREIVESNLHKKYEVARGSTINRARIKTLCDWYFENPDMFIKEFENFRKDPKFPIQLPLSEELDKEIFDDKLYKDLIIKDEVYRIALIIDFVSVLTDEEICRLSETTPINWAIVDNM